MNETSNAVKRMRDCHVAIAFDRLSQAPEAIQAEAIARHYLAHVNLARDLLELVRIRRVSVEFRTRDEELDALIAALSSQIRENHARDLGLELAWPKRA